MMSIPIFTYHSVGGTSVTKETMSPGQKLYHLDTQTFDDHIDFIAEKSFQAWTIDDLVERNSGMPAGHDPPMVCLTFDDGHASDYEVVFPALAARQLRGTFFVTTSWVGESGYVTWDQLREMHRYGMSIQSHSHSHPFLTECSLEQVQRELIQSREILEDQLSSPSTVFGVPGGQWHASFSDIARECGYQAVCTSESGINSMPCDLLALKRLSVRRDDPMERFISLITLDSKTLMLDRMKSMGLDALKKTLGLKRYNAVRRSLLQGKIGG